METGRSKISSIQVNKYLYFRQYLKENISFELLLVGKCLKIDRLCNRELSEHNKIGKVTLLISFKWDLVERETTLRTF